MKITGKIIINPYLKPKESLLQANRLKEEFALLGVDVEIVSDAFLRMRIHNGDILNNLTADFIVYLDKDKYVSEMLSISGARLFNSHNAIRVCDDKARTYIALAGSNINLPKTIFAPLCYSSVDPLPQGFAEKIVSELGLPIIIKECYGSMGKGIYKADDFDELISISEKLKTSAHLYQEYLPYRKGTDVRVICIGGKAVCAMIRENSSDFRSNIALGGKGKAIDIHDCAYVEFKKMAEKAANALELDYCGVDLIYGKDDSPYICEVNSNAFFNEMEKVSGINVASKYANYILDKIIVK